MTVHRIVLIRYKPEVTAEQRANGIAGINGLIRTIPQIKEIKTGRHTSHARDGGWHDGVIIVFDNFEDLHVYVEAEPHVKLVEEMSSYVAEKLAFDIEN